MVFVVCFQEAWSQQQQLREQEKKKMAERLHKLRNEREQLSEEVKHLRDHNYSLMAEINGLNQEKSNALLANRDLQMEVSWPGNQMLGTERKWNCWHGSVSASAGGTAEKHGGAGGKSDAAAETTKANVTSTGMVDCCHFYTVGDSCSQFWPIFSTRWFSKYGSPANDGIIMIYLYYYIDKNDISGHELFPIANVNDKQC